MIKKQVFWMMLFILILNFSTISAADLISEKNVSYDSDLMKAFDDRSYANQLMLNQDFIGLEVIDGEVWARVLVELRDNSGIIFNGTKEERLEQSKRIDQWFEPVIQSTLDELNKTGIKDINKSPFNSSFNALITKEGLEEIASNPNVKKIIWPQYGPELFLQESANITKTNNLWNLGYNGSGMKICVIDTGVNSVHPNLLGKIAAQHCFCSDNCCPDNTPEDDWAWDAGCRGCCF
jgi:subtilisin family serine protease